jgi:hypothetical protein
MAVSKYTPAGAFRYVSQPTVKDLPFQPWLAAGELDYKKAQETDKALSDAEMSIDAIYGDVELARETMAGYNADLDNITEQYHKGNMSHRQAQIATNELQRKHKDALATKAILEERKAQELEIEKNIDEMYKDTPYVANYMKAQQKLNFNNTPRGKDTPIGTVNTPRSYSAEELLKQERDVFKMVKETILSDPGKYSHIDLGGVHDLYTLVQKNGRSKRELQEIIEAHMGSDEMLNSFRIQAEANMFNDLKAAGYNDEDAMLAAQERGQYEVNYDQQVQVLDENGEPAYDKNGDPIMERQLIAGTGMADMMERFGTLSWESWDRDKFVTKDPIEELNAKYELDHAMGNINIVNNASQGYASTGYNSEGVQNSLDDTLKSLNSLEVLEEEMKTEGRLTPAKAEELDRVRQDYMTTIDLIKQRQAEAEAYAKPVEEEVKVIRKNVKANVDTILANAANTLTQEEIDYINSKDWTNYRTVGRPHQDPEYQKLSPQGKRTMINLQEALKPLAPAEEKYRTTLNTYYETHSKDIGDLWVGTDMPGAIGKLATKQKIALQKSIAEGDWRHLHSHNPNSLIFGGKNSDKSISQLLSTGGAYDGWTMKVTSPNGVGFTKTPIDNLGNHAFTVPITITDPTGKQYSDTVWLRTDQINNDDVNAILNSPEHKANTIWERGRRQGLERYTPYEFPNMTFVYGDRSTHTDDRVLIKMKENGKEVTYNYSIEEVFGANYKTVDGKTKKLDSFIVAALKGK